MLTRCLQREINIILSDSRHWENRNLLLIIKRRNRILLKVMKIFSLRNFFVTYHASLSPLRAVSTWRTRQTYQSARTSWSFAAPTSTATPQRREERWNSCTACSAATCRSCRARNLRCTRRIPRSTWQRCPPSSTLSRCASLTYANGSCTLRRKTSGSYGLIILRSHALRMSLMISTGWENM